MEGADAVLSYGVDAGTDGNDVPGMVLGMEAPADIAKDLGHAQRPFGFRCR